jgi:acetyl-CoA synthetase
MDTPRPAVIRKTAADLRLPPNLADWEGERRTFSWDAVWGELGTVPGGAINIGIAATDRHLGTPVQERVALHFVDRNDGERSVSYAELARLTNRFANVLQGLGVGRGDRLFLLMPRVPELYVAALGALKNATVVSPLFSAFGPEPIATRCEMGDARVLGIGLAVEGHLAR